MNHRDLEAVRQIINDSTGLDVSYAYDDLVFPDHSAFIIQFSDNSDDELICHFHVDCFEKDKNNIFANLKNECEKRDGIMLLGHKYSFEQKGDNVEIKFE